MLWYLINHRLNICAPENTSRIMMLDNAFIFNAQMLNNLFSQLSNKPDTVFWLSNYELNTQLYLSPNFETIWQCDTGVFFDRHQAWYDFLLPLDYDKVEPTMDYLRTDPYALNGQHTVFYRIKDGANQVRYIRDWSFLLHNNTNDLVAIGGVAEELNQELWHLLRDSQKKKKDTSIINSPGIEEDIFNILNRECKFILQDKPKLPGGRDQESQTVDDCFTVNNKRLQLSPREAQVIHFTRQGFSAKEVADKLCISPRTVETHLSHVKDKALCRTKLELITLLGSLPRD